MAPGPRSSLRTKILIILMPIMIIAALLWVAGVRFFNEPELLRQKISQQEMILDGVENGLDLLLDGLSRGVADLGPGARRQIKAMIRTYLRSPAVLGIAVLDEEMSVTALATQEGVEASFDDPGLKKAMEEGKVFQRILGKANLFDLGDSIEIFRPVIRGGRVVGGVWTLISIEDLTWTLRKSRRFYTLYLGISTLAMIALLTVLLTRIIFGPLKRVVEGMRHMERGDLDQRIDVESEDEIGQLSRAFNDMAGRLQDNQRVLQTHVEAMESANEDLSRSQEQLVKSQQELVKSEKMASLGRLAAGIAHEVGHPVGTILNYLPILKKGGNEPGEEREYLDEIEASALVIRTIIRRLLDYARPSSLDLKEINLNPIVENALTMAKMEKGSREKYSVDLKLSPDLPTVVVDETQFQQVMVNLIFNAYDAMPGGGDLLILSKRDRFKSTEGEIRQKPSRRKDDPPDRDYTKLRTPSPSSVGGARIHDGVDVVLVKVVDSGIGIPEENLSSIFDPFFTTKESGTGLGLSVSIQMIETIGGHIRVESRKNEGTQVSIFIPIPEQETSDSSSEAPDVEGDGGTDTAG